MSRSKNISAYSAPSISTRDIFRRGNQQSSRPRSNRNTETFSFIQSSDESCDDGEDSWDEEETLVSTYLKNDVSARQQNISGLADGIETIWSQHREQLRKDVIEVVLPAVKKSKYTKQVLDEEVDTTTINGIEVFSDACKKMEALLIKEKKQVGQAYNESTTNLKQLYQQLEDAYMRKQAHWDAYSDQFEKLCNESTQKLLAAPAELEGTIASIDKKSKQLSKTDTNKTLKSVIDQWN